MLTEKDISTLVKTISILSTNVRILKSSGEHIAARDTLELCGQVQKIIDTGKEEAAQQASAVPIPKEMAAAVTNVVGTAVLGKPGITK